MSGNVIRMTIYLISWAFWIFRHFIFFPAGMLALIIGLLMIREHSSPGRILVNIIQNADSVTNGVNWSWRECPKIESAAGTYPLKVPSAPSVLSSDCPVFVSDAEGYAEHFDGNIMPILGMLWSIMAFLRGVIAFRAGTYPCLTLPAVRITKGIAR